MNKASKPIQAVQPTSKAKKGGDYSKLSDGSDVVTSTCNADKLPPPPPDMLRSVTNERQNNRYETVMRRMPSPPPSPNDVMCSPKPGSTSTTSTSISTLGSYHSKRSAHLPVHQHGVHTMPSQNRLGRKCASPRTPRTPHSADYSTNRNSFEFPAPPPEVLRQNAQNFPVDQNSGGKSTSPEQDILRYRIVDPKFESNRKYGLLAKEDHNSLKAHNDAVSSIDNRTGVPFEYGYHLKTGQKFKIYQSPHTIHRALGSTANQAQSRAERNRKIQSVSTAASAPQGESKTVQSAQQGSNTGTL